MADERWRDIPGHKGYQASSLGRVRSVPRTLRDGREAGGVVLVPQEDKDGYLTVQFGRKRVRVHVAVALAFHGRPEIRHLNGDRKDNRPEVLAWGSHWENVQDTKRHKAERLGHFAEGPLPAKTLPVTRLIRLSDAVSQGIISSSLDAVRKASQRDPLFPGHKAVRGLAKLYDAAELYAWDQPRTRRYS